MKLRCNEHTFVADRLSRMTEGVPLASISSCSCGTQYTGTCPCQTIWSATLHGRKHRLGCMCVCAWMVGLLRVCATGGCRWLLHDALLGPLENRALSLTRPGTSVRQFWGAELLQHHNRSNRKDGASPECLGPCRPG